MTYSNRGGSNFSGGSYGRRDFNDRGSDRPALFDATCAQCGAACKVPFKPNGRKEVFCSKCFETQGGGASRETSFSAPRGQRMFDKRDGGAGFGDRQMFSATCDQCGERCQVPFRPTNGKPVLCSNCFADKTEGRNFQPSLTPKNNSLDLETINAKLDRILKLLTPVAPKEIKKELTEKILEEIQTSAEKKLVAKKKPAKKA